MDSAERKKHSSGAFPTKNPVHERDLQGVGVSQDQRPQQQQLVPEDCGGVNGHSHGNGIELVEVIDTESSLQTFQMGMADSSDEQIRDSIPLPSWEEGAQNEAEGPCSITHNPTFTQGLHRL